MADEPVSRMQPWSIVNTQFTDSVEIKFVSDVSFGSEVRILATTLPQFLVHVGIGQANIFETVAIGRNNRFGIFGTSMNPYCL